MWDAVRRQLRQQRRLESRLPPVRANVASRPGAVGGSGIRPNAGRLSVTQERLWRLDRATAAGRLSYNVTYPLTVYGDLDLEALRGAVDDLVMRHEALRTSFVDEGRGPQRVVGARRGSLVEFTDLTGSAPAEANDWLDRLAAHRFGLGDGAPIRVFVGRRSSAERLMMLVGHHIVLDGRSLSVILGELGKAYSARVLNQPQPSAAPELQAGDFIEWQWSWLASPAGEPYRTYWLRRLACPAFARAGTVLGRPPGLDFSGGLEECEIPAAVRRRVADLARDLDVPAVSVYFRTYQALLHAYTSERFLVCGLPAANRGRSELAEVVGFLVNVLPVASDLRSDLDVREAVRAADRAMADAYVHQAMPVEYVTPQVRPDLDRSLLTIDHFFAAYRRVVAHPLSMAGLTLGPAPALAMKDCEFPFMMTVMEVGATAVARLSYGNWVAGPGQVARLVAAYVRLLDRATSAPAGRLRDHAAAVVRQC